MNFLSGLAILSNVTVGSLLLRLQKELKESGEGDKEVLTPPGFDVWRMELLNAASPLWGKNISSIYILLHGPAFFPDGITARFEERLAGFRDILLQARAAHEEKSFVVSTLDLPSSPARPLASENFALKAAAWWRGKLEEAGFPILDIAELAADAGRERFYSPKMWYFASLPFSQQGETLLAREILRVENALAGRRKKCLVLDLDGTLWGGVIGEDGLEGLTLASTGMGSQYRDVQSIVRELGEQGVLLAVASKNNLEDALLPFREHPHMLLRERDFVKIKADWNPKPDNIAAIARELNIGLDSLVFVDDNPAERAAVRAALPEVAVPEDFPAADSSALPGFMARVARRYFTMLRPSEEDRRKTEMYQAESEREAARKSCQTPEDYLASLEMKLDLHRLRENEVPRAAQLTQKTNQFNLTSKRYSEADLEGMLRDESVRVWMAGLKDRFGDYGRICLVIVRRDSPESALVDSFLMSCRVMGRGVEDAVLSGIEAELEAEGVSILKGRYVETPKNMPVRDFWERMGYTASEDLWVSYAPFLERRTRICRGS
ncbi:MAG: HAD-IIIC family phosphatase [Synergistaceae bacterium]|nr:HAD-IIIC family phosphatase [Synergistaceae bacterium]